MIVKSALVMCFTNFPTDPPYFRQTIRPETSCLSSLIRTQFSLSALDLYVNPVPQEKVVRAKTLSNNAL
ncbi:hypothetical protein PISMIDRAFT_399890 [Pisolithus microcarpus 441]|uniref:Uncharacterized protein n=1 Tax=Pisolithus microcarpus 441 TaxID=765257 RepID=A0A0C9Z0K6_9AGAM|nr:hypothetical protein PISMIDRAFT_399890 [Pisolithus microcarpus 441]